MAIRRPLDTNVVDITGDDLASNIAISTTGNIATTGSGTLSVAGATTVTGDLKASTIKDSSGTRTLASDSGSAWGLDSAVAKAALNATGSAPIFACRAWINFSGSSATSATDMTGVVGSGNVSSLVDRGTGEYTINFTSDMPNTTYTMTQSAGPTGGVGLYMDTRNVGSILVACKNYTGGTEDASAFGIAIHG